MRPVQSMSRDKLEEYVAALRAQLSARDERYRGLAEEHEARMAENERTIAELTKERDVERLRYGQQQARNAVFMQGLARLARMEPSVQGIGELVRGIVAGADRAATNVRLEDFTTARVYRATGAGETRCLECAHTLTEADRKADVCPHCGVA